MIIHILQIIILKNIATFDVNLKYIKKIDLKKIVHY
jgi:hypothetical protein